MSPTLVRDVMSSTVRLVGADDSIRSAAEAMEADDIGAVVHYDPPKDAKEYLHRSGRTARAGRDGWAVTLVEYNQHTQMRILQRTLRLPLTPPIEVFSNDVRLRDLSSFAADESG